MKSADGRFEFLKMDYEQATSKAEIARFGFPCPRGYGLCTGLLIVGADLGNGEILKRPSKVPCWSWDGDVEKPTFKPSIHCRSKTDDGREAAGCDWHGYITGGVIK